MGLTETVVKTWKCDHCGCHTQVSPMSGEGCWGTMKLERHAGVDGPSEKSRSSVILLLCGTCFDRFDPLLAQGAQR